MMTRPRLSAVPAGVVPWRVRLRYTPTPRPTLAALLDVTRTVECGLHELGESVCPCSVLIRPDGVAIAVTVEAAGRDQAVEAARQVIHQVIDSAGIAASWLGPDREVSARRGWRTAPR
jgi:hypothetical protein